MLFSIEGKSVVIMGTAELRSFTSSLRVLPFLNTCRVIFHLPVLRVSKRLHVVMYGNTDPPDLGVWGDISKRG